jgi:hypothetical protein
MSLGHGSKITTNGLSLVIDPGNVKCVGPNGVNSPGYSPFKDLVGNRSFTITNNMYVTGKTYYTCIGLTYPESSQTYPNRQGITPGINNTSAGKLYSNSRDMGYYVWDDDTETWVSDSYFNGERTNGHCYDTYDGAPSQHAKFQADYRNITATFPNATHIIIGSHAAENNDNDAETLKILKSLGLPDSHIGVGRPEYILIGKPNKKGTQAYLRENVNSAVGLMNIGLPIGKGLGFEFNGSSDYLDLGSDIVISPDNQGWTAEFWFNSDSASTLQHFNSAENDEFNANWLALYNSKLAVWNRNPGYWRYGDTVIQSNTWYQGVFVCDAGGTNMRFYINGKREGGDHVNNAWTASYSSLETRYIGRYEYNGGYSRYWNGEIGVVRMYNRALTDNEVAHNFAATRGRYGI